MRPVSPTNRFALLWLFALCALPTLGATASATGSVAPHGQPGATACPAATASPAAAGQFPLAVADDAGREVRLAAPPRRIVSIAPSNTEVLFALGLGERVVAVDQYSDFPAEAAAKATLGSYVDPDLEGIAAATPDLVLATGVHEQTVVPELEALGLPVAVVEPNDLEEVFAGIGLVGRLTGEEARATALVCDLLARVDAVAERIAGASRSRVFFELSPELHTAGPGSFVADLIARAGGENVAAGAGEEWPQLDAEALVAADPEVILLADHEAGITAETVRGRPGWQGVSAVETGRIVAIDPDLTNRPGPRVVDGLEAIARALHPDRFAR